MEIKGQIICVMPTTTGVSKTTNKPWSIQTIVISYMSGSYEKKLALDLSGDKCDKFSEGQVITAQITPESREFKGRWYTSIRAWKVDVEESQAPAPAADPFNSPATGGDEGPEQDLPF